MDFAGIFTTTGTRARCQREQRRKFNVVDLGEHTFTHIWALEPAELRLGFVTLRLFVIVSAHR